MRLSVVSQANGRPPHSRFYRLTEQTSAIARPQLCFIMSIARSDCASVGLLNVSISITPPSFSDRMAASRERRP
jgi:hypothetical protein